MTEEGTSVVRVEHAVPVYEAWKREAFDRDPLGRERSGVRRYRVLRGEDEPGLVAIDLEFDSSSLAKDFAGELAGLWRRVAERFGWTEAPKVRIFELVAAEEYRG
jgi:hypothetical protein